jgi:hypothetical protein
MNLTEQMTPDFMGYCHYLNAEGDEKNRGVDAVAVFTRFPYILVLHVSRSWVYFTHLLLNGFKLSTHGLKTRQYFRIERAKKRSLTLLKFVASLLWQASEFAYPRNALDLQHDSFLSGLRQVSREPFPRF